MSKKNKNKQETVNEVMDLFGFVPTATQTVDEKPAPAKADKADKGDKGDKGDKPNPVTDEELALSLYTPESKGVKRSTLAKAYRDITKQSMTLNKAIKTLNGMLSEKYPVGDKTMTCREILELGGVVFPVDDKGKKGRFTLAVLNAAWPHKVTNDKGATTYFVNKNVSAYYVDNSGEEPISVGVYYKHKTKGYKRVSRYMAAPVGQNSWTVETILKGFLQAGFPEYEVKKVKKSTTDWNDLKAVCVVDCTNTDREMHADTAYKAIEKGEVNF